MVCTVKGLPEVTRQKEKKSGFNEIMFKTSTIVPRAVVPVYLRLRSFVVVSSSQGFWLGSRQ